MGEGTFTLKQIGDLSAEFKAKFGKDHRVAIIHEPDDGYKIQYPLKEDDVYTVVNAVEPAIADAVFRYGKAIASQSYTILNSDVSLRVSAGTKSEFESIVGDAHAEDGKEIMGFLFSLAPHVWAMARHDQAADYTRFEMVKFSCLRNTVPDSRRALLILARAHVRVAADAYDVDVDPSEITSDISLNVDDLAVLKTAKKMLKEVRRQGMRGANIDMTDGIGEFAEAVRAQLSSYSHSS